MGRMPAPTASRSPRTASVARDPMPWGHTLAFYIGIPLMFAVLNGANHAGMAHGMSVTSGVVYWIGLCVPLWLVFDLMTRGVALALRPWTPPLWLVLLAGAVAGLLVVPPYVDWYVTRMVPLLSNAPTRFEAVRLLQVRVTDIDRLIGMTVWPSIWIGINYYYDRMLSIPRYRGLVVEIAATAESPTSSPIERPLRAGVQPVSEEGINPAVADPLGDIGFLRQLPAKVGTEIVALQAEDHYIRVYTALGNALVRYRFKDAVREVAPLGGMRVHRSFWVCEKYVTRVRPAGDGLELLMSSGLRIPVSRASLAAVRARNWTPRGGAGLPLA